MVPKADVESPLKQIGKGIFLWALICTFGDCCMKVIIIVSCVFIGNMRS